MRRYKLRMIEFLHPELSDTQARTSNRHGHPGQSETGSESQKTSLLSLIRIAGEALVQSGVQDPINGATQLVDKICDRNVLPQLSLVQDADEAPLGTARWYAQTIGSGAGSILPFLLVEFTTRKTGELDFVANLRDKTDQVPILKSLAGTKAPEFMTGTSKMFLDGALYGGVLVPVDDQQGDFWKQRAAYAGAVSMTFGSQYMVAHGLLHAIEVSHVGDLHFDKAAAITLKTGAIRIGTNLIGGSAAGAIGAESESALYTQRPASLHSVEDAVAAFAVAGLTLDSGHIAQEKVIAHGRAGLRKPENAQRIRRISNLPRQAYERLRGTSG
jgi:hypothetical protein